MFRRQSFAHARARERRARRCRRIFFNSPDPFTRHTAGEVNGQERACRRALPLGRSGDAEGSATVQTVEPGENGTAPNLVHLCPQCEHTQRQEHLPCAASRDTPTNRPKRAQGAFCSSDGREWHRARDSPATARLAGRFCGRGGRAHQERPGHRQKGGHRAGNGQPLLRTAGLLWVRAKDFYGLKALPKGPLGSDGAAEREMAYRDGQRAFTGYQRQAAQGRCLA